MLTFLFPASNPTETQLEKSLTSKSAKMLKVNKVMMDDREQVLTEIKTRNSDFKQVHLPMFPHINGLTKQWSNTGQQLLLSTGQLSLYSVLHSVSTELNSEHAESCRQYERDLVVVQHRKKTDLILCHLT